MDKVFDIFKKLQSTTKRNAKIQILKENQDNTLFQTTLKWLLNPFEITGISTKNSINKFHITPLLFRLGEI